MSFDQAAILAVLAVVVLMFVWGQWRHDMVAVGALLACVFLGLVPADDAFAGFGHPAVVTVAGVLILSRALQTSGAVDAISHRLLPKNIGQLRATVVLTSLATVLSAFMNNVGALALLMPLALQISARQQAPPGRMLMPLAYGSILGGMTTLIGTPPNLIVSAFRARASGTSFSMFDFAPVGVPVAVAGVIFILVFAAKLVPLRRPGTEGFEVEAYTTEARVPEGARAVGMAIGEIEKTLEEVDAFVIGLVRNEVRIGSIVRSQKVRAGDILVIEADSKVLGTALSKLNLVLEEDQKIEDPPETAASPTEENSAEGKDEKEPAAKPLDDTVIVELVVLPNSSLVGQSATDIHLRARYGINLLAISRRGGRSRARLRTTPILGGDVLMVQGLKDRIAGFGSQFGCLPLAERMVRIPNRRETILAGAIMAAAIIAAAFGLTPAAIAFTAGVLAVMATGVMPPRTVYTAVDWPVIVLLGSLIPVAEAMATTGTADLIAQAFLAAIGDSRVLTLVVIMVVTMTLSDFLNNAATAAVMCPIAIGAARSLGVSADPFLIAVAVGAACAFLTPIGHQNSTLILGPGGFRFGDYWRLGLPLEVVVVCTAIPMILVAWPF